MKWPEEETHNDVKERMHQHFEVAWYKDLEFISIA